MSQNTRRDFIAIDALKFDVNGQRGMNVDEQYEMNVQKLKKQREEQRK